MLLKTSFWEIKFGPRVASSSMTNKERYWLINWVRWYFFRQPVLVFNPVAVLVTIRKTVFTFKQTCGQHSLPQFFWNQTRWVFGVKLGARWVGSRPTYNSICYKYSNHSLRNWFFWLQHEFSIHFPWDSDIRIDFGNLVWFDRFFEHD